MNDLFTAINPIHIARVAGSGNKIIHLIDRKADYYLNLVPGFKYWDMCASDALIRGMQGIVTDANRNPIIYDHEKENFTIREGIMIAKNQKVLNVCDRRIFNNTG